MKIAVPKERRANELRVAASPDTVKKFIGLGFEVTVESGAGLSASITDAAFAAAGATIAPDAKATYAGAGIVLKVQRPLTAMDVAAGEGDLDELALIPSGAKLVAILSPYGDPERVKAYAAANVDAFAMEFMPRITRAQSMDVLSSQSNLAGYRAVIEASNEFARAFPMMMTAAGTVPPARAFIMGAGVAGLQAIATAKRLGAVVSATDVRPATKEQVESLGGSFVAVMDEEFQQAQTAGGYAKEMSAEYRAKQAALVAEHIKKQDIVITTALIPGRKAPLLVTADMVKSMKTGAIIVDMAVEQGGNVEGSVAGQVVEVNGVKIVGRINMPSRIAVDASLLYAKNLLNFLTPLVDKETKALKLDMADEVVAGTALTRDGQVVHPAFASRQPDPVPAAVAPEPVPAEPAPAVTEAAAATVAVHDTPPALAEEEAATMEPAVADGDDTPAKPKRTRAKAKAKTETETGAGE